MNKILKGIALFILIVGLQSCQNDSRPNYQFFPQMYESLSYEAYSAGELFDEEQTALLPPEGTVARGFSIYPYENNNEDFELARTELKNPLSEEILDLEKGKELYTIYCAICHGNKGKGQGYLVKQEKILGVPSYADAGRNITEGSTYHVIYYGKNSMGSYAGQINEEERWQVTAYVMKLKSEITE